jgi:DNA adenine methylase
LYEHVQKNKDELFDAISRYMLIYNSLTGVVINRKPKTEEEGKSSKESYYYWLRTLFNKIDKDSIDSSALFLILNKTCFRGVYREGPNGFNVPYGHYKTTPIVIQKHHLDEASFLVKDVHFICSDFTDSLKNVKAGDYVYLDPPYAPESKTSFVGYTSNGFSLEMHERLFDNIKEINEKNIKFTMSNAKVDLVTDSFKDFNCTEITARRAINCKNPESSTKEVIISN